MLDVGINSIKCKELNMQFMKYAIESAKEGVTAQDGGPFGACIVKNGEVIATAHNTVIKDHDPTCHAEMNAIRLAAKKLGTHILEGCELYTTSEPCPMCLSAIYWARIEKIYAGATREVAAEFGFRDEMLYDELQRPLADRLIPTKSGIMESECKAMFRTWQSLERPLY